MTQKRIVLSGFMAILTIGAVQAAFVHPGIPLTISDLDAVKAKVNVGQQPWKTGYDYLAADGHSQLTYTMQGPFSEVGRNIGGTGVHLHRNEWMNDMQAVWSLSCMWYFTGNSAYAQKARDILIAWANTQTLFSGYESNLDLGDYAFRYAGGADILRGTWSGWAEADTTAVKNLFANVYWPATGVGNFTLGAGNKGGLSLSAGTAIAVFCDDSTKLNQALYLLRTFPSTGFANTASNGEHGETGRDQGHSYGQMLAMGFIAEVFWKQGIDVYSELDNRILAMGEYYARYNLGVYTPYIPMGTTDAYYLGIGDAPGYIAEPMAFNIMKSHYVLRKGLSAPYLERKLLSQPQNINAFMFLKSSNDGSTAMTPDAITFPTASLVGTGLTNIDIGGAYPTGNGTYSNGIWTVKGEGSDIWTHGTEAFHYVYRQVTGDCTMIARVNSVQNTIGFAKAGVMIRSDLNAEPAAKAWAAVIPDIKVEGYLDGWAEIWAGANFEAQSRPIPQIPYWVKIERLGNIITAYASPDGTTWGTIVAGKFDAMPTTAYIGLAVTSNVDGMLNTSTFSNVSVTGGSGGSITVPAAPLAVYASPGDAQASLRWSASFGATSYIVKRATTSGGPYTPIATGVTKQSYVDTDLTNGTTYYYVVRAVNSAGESGDSPEDVITKLTGPCLAAYYKLDGNVTDSSNHGYRGTAIGSPVYSTGQIGQALNLDGTDDFIVLPADVANHEDITVTAWVYWNGGSQWQRIFDFGTGTNQYLFLTPNSGSGTLRFAIKNGGNEQIVETLAQMATAQWVHVAVTLSGNTAKLYINGELKATNTAVTINPSDFNPAINYIGKSQWSDPLFSGSIDEFRIYNFALTAAQITATMAGNTAPVFTSDPINNVSAVELSSYLGTSLAAYANDADGMNTITFSKVSGPDWLAVASNGALSGIPLNANVGANIFTVGVTDNGGLSDTAIMNINVANIYNGTAGITDLLGLASQWLTSGCTDIPACNGADLDGDADVDLADMAVLSQNWLLSEVPEDLQLDLKLDETSGTTAADSSFYNRPGTLTNGPVWSAGHTGNALSFDGTDDYVEISGYQGITGTTGRTCSAWIKTIAVQQGDILSWGAEQLGQKWMFRMESNGVLSVGIWGGYISTTAAINNGQWHHVAAVLNNDGSLSVNEIQLYIDGVLQSASAGNSQSIGTVASQNVILGAFKSAGVPSVYFNGLMDDVRIYNRALTAAEIAAMVQ